MRWEYNFLIVYCTGSSLEILWIFSSKLVANNRLYQSNRVVKAIGHEADITIAGFIATLRTRAVIGNRVGKLRCNKFYSNYT